MKFTERLIKLLVIVAFVSCSANSHADTLIKGADVSWLSEMEDAGYAFYDENGTQQDFLTIMKSYGMEAVRLRVWVNPSDGWYSGLQDVILKAQRAKAAGMKVMIDFHYSDTWADPGQQTKPAAWSSYSTQGLMDVVWSYTRSSLLSLSAAGVTPDWVQVGNETNNGMLWDNGKASVSMQNYAWLTATGYNAVKDVFPNTPVVVHLANCYDNDNFRWIFDGFQANGGKFDIIGASDYPTNVSGYTWQQANAACLTNLNDMVSRYGAPVMITEVGVPWDHSSAQSIVADLIAKVRSVANNQGIAVFYWEPEAWPSWKGYTLGASDNSGKPTAAMKAFLEASSNVRLQARHSGKCADVVGARIQVGTALIQYTCGSGNNQKWSFQNMEGDYERLQVAHSGQCMDLASQSGSNLVKVVQATCGAGNSQQWLREYVSGSYYRLKNRYSGKCLDVSGASTANNAALIQYTCGSGYNQQWLSN